MEARSRPTSRATRRRSRAKPGGPYTNEAVGAENYGTLAYIAESPHEKGVIWTGSDDGLVQLTRDDGATWKNVTPTRAGRVPDQRDRGVAVRQGDGVHRDDAVQVQRSRAGPVQDDRLRRDLDEDRSREFRPTRSRAWCARTTSGATCSSRARSVASSSHGTAGGTGRRSSSTCRSRRSPTCASTRAT